MFRVRSLLIIQHRCPTTARFGGVIHLHDMGEDRAGSCRYPTEYLSAPEPLRHVLLVTTKWGKKGASHACEDELKKTHLGTFLPNNTTPCRFMDTQESAWGIVNTLLGIGLLDCNSFREDLDRIRDIYEIQRIASQKLPNQRYRFR